VQQRIESITEPKKDFSFSFSGNRTKPYEGKLIDRFFEISRIINYRNSRRPRWRPRQREKVNVETMNTTNEMPQS
jgi:hypothetical protein